MESDPKNYGVISDELFSRQGRPPSNMRSKRQFNTPEQVDHAKIVIELKGVYEGGTRDFTLRAPEFDPGGHVVLQERTN